MHDQVQPALEVVEHRDFGAEHQQDVGRAQFVVLLRAAAQARFQVLHALEAEPADQAAGEAGQAFDPRHRVRGAQALDLGEGILDLTRLDQFAVLGHVQGVAGEGVYAFRGQADDRVATEALAALDRFEQVGMRAVGQLQVHRQRRVEVGQDLAHDRNEFYAGVSGGTGAGTHAGHPSTDRQGRRQRWRQATIASPAGPWTKECGRGSSWADSSRRRDGGASVRRRPRLSSPRPRPCSPAGRRWRCRRRRCRRLQPRFRRCCRA